MTVTRHSSGAIRIPTYIAERTAGDITITNTVAAVDSAIDLVISAAVGDILEFGISAWASQTNYATDPYMVFGPGIMVGGSPVFFLGNNSITFNEGIPAWAAPQASYYSEGQSFTVLSGTYCWKVTDPNWVVNGSITFRLFGCSYNQDRLLRASSQDPLRWWVKNLGQ